MVNKERDRKIKELLKERDRLRALPDSIGKEAFLRKIDFELKPLLLQEVVEGIVYKWNIKGGRKLISLFLFSHKSPFI